jgi:dipeptidase E
MAYQLIHGVADTPLCEVGWKSLGVLELTALPSIDRKHWTTAVQDTDALLVGGGNPLYLCDWMKRSGLADLLPSLHETVYVGVSAGSTVMAPTLGEGFVRSNLPGGDTALGLVDFAMFPHLDDEELPGKSMNHAEKWAASVPIPAFAIDDQTAIKVTDGVVEVVSEGRWKLFEPTPETS